MNGILAASLVALLVLASPAAAQVGAKPTGDVRVKSLLTDLSLKFEVDADGDFRLLNETTEGRTQLVWVLSQTTKLGEGEPGAIEIREVWSIAYRSKTPFSAKIANRLLEQNAKVKLGSFQVRKMGEEYVAVFSAQIAADTDKRTLLLAILAVQSTADQLELELTEKDDY